MDTIIDIAKLTPEQLATIAKQLKAERKAKTGDPKKRNVIIDRMLQEKNGSEFKHTTADILAQLQTDGVVTATLSADERAGELKKIQTRKQLLCKKGETDEVRKANAAKYGYKVSANGFTLTLERVLEWLKTAKPEDRKAIAKAAK